MSAPLCHRMMNDPGWTEHCRCQGSACALWVPEVLVDNGSKRPVLSIIDTGITGTLGALVQAGMGARTVSADFAAGTYTDDTDKPTGRGWCSENLRRQPWTDPAADNDNSAADGGGEE